MSADLSRRGVLRSSAVLGAAVVVPGRAAAAGTPRDVRTWSAPATSLLDAIRTACGTMQRVFNPQDEHRPWFGHHAVPHREGFATFYFSGAHDESHVPGRHLLALLEARSIGVAVLEDTVARHRAALYFGLSREVPLPQNRRHIGAARPSRFLPHNVREGLHGLYALYAHSREDRATARDAIENIVAAIRRHWTPDAGWSRNSLTSVQPDIELVEWGGPFITGLGRAIGPLTRYWELSRARGEESAAAGDLLDTLVDVAGRHLPANGTGRPEVLGTHTHSITCTLSGLARYAAATGNDAVMDRVFAFYRVGLTAYRDELGWSVENGADSSDRGECNNSGDIVETALILGDHGHPECYADAATIIRAHLLPSQLHDASFMVSAEEPYSDADRDVAARITGGFGFPAPYGHLPDGWTNCSFNLDIVGGVTSSLCAAYRAVVRRDGDDVTVTMPFDHSGGVAEVRVTAGPRSLTEDVTLAESGDLRIVLPQWCDPSAVTVSPPHPVEHQPHRAAIVVRSVPAGQRVRVMLPTPRRQIHLGHRRHDIRVQLRGDQVIAMDSLGTELPFFPAVRSPVTVQPRGLAVHWPLDRASGDDVDAVDNTPWHRLRLLGGARIASGAGRFGGMDGADAALRLEGKGQFAAAGIPSDLGFGAGSFTVAARVRTAMSGKGRIVSRGSYGWTCGFFLSVGHGGPGHLGFGVGAGERWGGFGSVEAFTAEALVGDDTWHHVAATVDRTAGLVRLYVDGTARPLVPTPGTHGHPDGDRLLIRDDCPAVASAPTALTIGSHLGRDEFFVGTVADVRLYDRALGLSELSRLAAG